MGGVGIGFSGRLLPGNEPALLSAETRGIVGAFIRARTKDASAEGTVREVDFDKRTFRVRTQAATLRCRFGSELANVMEYALNQRVRVAATAQIYADGRMRDFSVSSSEPF